MRAISALFPLLLSLALVACAPPPAADAGSDGGSDDSGDDSSDAGDPLDAGADDDAAAPDAGAEPQPGFGAITGPCGVLDDELTSAEPAFIVNAIDFGDDPYDAVDYDLLSAGGQEIIADGNAGGSSLLSEVFAYEVLLRCEGAELLKTETEVTYLDPQGKITDLLVRIDGVVIGVSVTRAVAFPFENPYSVEQARTLLEQKLEGVLASSANVAPMDAWQKQVLSVIAYGDGHAAALEEALALIDEDTKADTVVYVTVSHGDDAFLY